MRLLGWGRPLLRLADDRHFLRLLHRFERQLAKLLAQALSLVLLVAALQLVGMLLLDLTDLQVRWYGQPLINLLDRILVLLIALEVLQNLTAYLREQGVQIELVLMTALTAVARKVIVMPPEMQKSPAELLGLGVGILSLAGAYWLVRHSHRRQAPIRARPPRAGQATGCQGPDPSAAPDGGGGG